LIAGNWKMNTTVEEAKQLVSIILPEIESVESIDRVICPPFTSLTTIRRQLDESSVELGAQNLYFKEKGAYTGEISPIMLSGLCRFVIIGHSERRQYFNETDSDVNRKLKAAVKEGLKPILCVGENLVEREGGQAEEVVTRQLVEALEGADESADIVVAYEPIWAIGSGLAANGQQANDIAALIRKGLAG
jgi:triosephosphate isomerase